jgi:DNA-directed RNA polymerase specialized sigma24 family protein
MNESTPKFGAKWLNEVLDDSAAYERFAQFHNQLLKSMDRRISEQYWGRIAASDILQTAFRTFYRRVVTDKLVVHDEGEAMAMIAAISKKKLLKKIEYFNADKRTGEVAIGELASVLDPHHISPDEQARCREIIEATQARLPSERLHPVLDRVIEGYTSKEIREMMPDVADHYVRLVRKTLREILEEWLAK